MSCASFLTARSKMMSLLTECSIFSILYAVSYWYCSPTKMYLILASLTMYFTCVSLLVA